MGNIYDTYITCRYIITALQAKILKIFCRKNPRDNPTPASLHKKDGAQRLGGESQSHHFFVDLLREIVL